MHSLPLKECKYGGEETVFSFEKLLGTGVRHIHRSQLSKNVVDIEIGE